jgi:hypothetical protein
MLSQSMAWLAGEDLVTQFHRNLLLAVGMFSIIVIKTGLEDLMMMMKNKKILFRT